MRRSLLPAAFILCLFVTIGCSHALHVTNVHEYSVPPTSPLKEAIRVGVTSPDDSHVQKSRYISAVVDALKRSNRFARVIYPYDQSFDRDQVDVVVDMTVSPRYSGRGSNFFVSWPGFLIWAPALFGYGYIADIETRANVTRLNDDRSRQLTIPTRYKFRQAEFDRTWIEISWLEWSVIALIGGIFFIQYDPDVTDEFITEVSPSYGPYVASKIVATLETPAVPTTEPPAASDTPETAP